MREPVGEYLREQGEAVVQQLGCPPHLGGYVPGGDEATWYPNLWTWLVQDEAGPRVRSVLDVGCGEGHSTRFFREICPNTVGIDGTWQDSSIVQHDFTTGPWLGGWADINSALRSGLWDLVWCCEFVEHVEERYVPNFLETFKLAKHVLLTHAFPGQDGHHHVNCQPREYWVGALAAIGYGLDEELTTRTRNLAALNRSPWNHYVRSGLAFRRITC